jgi:hypothetical protein
MAVSFLSVDDEAERRVRIEIKRLAASTWGALIAYRTWPT